jgi:transposase
LASPSNGKIISDAPPLAQSSDSQREQLADILDSGPVAHGLNTGVWTSPLIAQIIHEEFGVSYHSGHVRHLLKGLNFSVQRPKTRLVQADPKKQNRWIRLKKTPGMKAR